MHDTKVKKNIDLVLRKLAIQEVRCGNNICQFWFICLLSESTFIASCKSTLEGQWDCECLGHTEREFKP